MGIGLLFVCRVQCVLDCSSMLYGLLFKRDDLNTRRCVFIFPMNLTNFLSLRQPIVCDRFFYLVTGTSALYLTLYSVTKESISNQVQLIGDVFLNHTCSDVGCVTFCEE